MSENKRSQVRTNQGKDFDLDILAKLCSVGTVPIPNDLTESQQRQLLESIAKRRRKRLFNLFAATIDDAIGRSEKHEGAYYAQE